MRAWRRSSWAELSSGFILDCELLSCKLWNMKKEPDSQIWDTNPGWWTLRLAAPLIAAAAVRLVLAIFEYSQMGVSALLHSDTYTYLIPGRNLLLHGQFMADGVPDLLRTPGYPLFLAVTSLGGFPLASAINQLLSALTLILVWKLGRAVFQDERIALGAVWLFAFEPIAMGSSFVLTSETLFLAIFLLCMERLAAFLRGRDLRVLAVAGLLLGVTTLVRPVTYYLPVALAAGLFVVLARIPTLRWKAPAVLLICVIPWLAAWQIRNRLETGYHGFTSISDAALYYLSAACLAARLEHRPANDVIEELQYGDYAGNSGQSYLFAPYLAQHPEQAGWSQAQRLAFMHDSSVSLIKAHLGTYLGLCAKDLVTIVFYPGVYYFDRSLHPKHPGHTSGIFNESQSISKMYAKVQADPFLAVETALSWMVLLAVYLLAARALWLAARGSFHGSLHSASLWLLLGVSVYFLAVSAALVQGPLATARYRLPVMPVVCILAAAGFQRSKAMWQS